MKKEQILVKVDSRNRITIPKQMAKKLAHLYKIYEKDGKIILEPIKEIPDNEKWLFLPENKEILEKIKKALKQKANISLGSFSQYNEEL